MALLNNGNWHRHPTRLFPKDVLIPRVICLVRRTPRSLSIDGAKYFLKHDLDCINFTPPQISTQFLVGLEFKPVGCK